MLVFVDESGDSGIQKRKGSSSLFIIVAVLFVDVADATACDSKIDELRQRLFGNDHREFKFNKCCRDHRNTFLKETGQSEYLYYGFVLNKSMLYGEGFKYKSPFYKYTAKLLFENVKAYLSDATVVIDGSGEREFQQQLQSYLKAKINADGSDIIKKVKIQKSHSNNLLQLADMVCGALARCYRTEKDDCQEYREIIRRRELGVTVWPRPRFTRKKRTR